MIDKLSCFEIFVDKYLTVSAQNMYGFLVEFRDLQVHRVGFMA